MWLPELQKKKRKKSTYVAHICGPHYISAGPCWWYHCFKGHRTGLDSCLSRTNWWADLGLNSDHWNLKPLLLHNIKLPSWHQGETASQVASLRWIQKTESRFPHQPSPNLCHVKILHFPWPFLHNFSINPKTAFTEGRFWTEHNFHFTESDKASKALENLSKVPIWGQER